MITLYIQKETAIIAQLLTNDNEALIKEALWIDLLAPTAEEESLIEEYLAIDVPTKKEMEEIEPSNRLYKEDNILFMTATMLAKSESPEPTTDAVTFILTKDQLLTVRYIEPHSFELFKMRLSRLRKPRYTAAKLLISLLSATVDRMADILEAVSHRLDRYSIQIFHAPSEDANAAPQDYKTLLQNIGANGDLGTKTRECLTSFNRLVYFLSQSMGITFKQELQSRIGIITKDIEALSDHANFIASKVGFLLNATMGMINIEQNNIIKIFSVAAVIFLPPTLIASIYGMNFHAMPELSWSIGYPLAIMLMLISAWLPFSYFKRRKWL